MSKRIYIYSPSGAVRDRAAFRRGVAMLKSLGHEVEVDPAALSSHQRFAGDDATRLEAINRALDSDADLALITRGGYGYTRLLPQLPYRKVARAVRKGMVLMGMSDFTAFQCAVLAKTETPTWAGPALCEGFGAHQPDEIMVDCFQDLMVGRSEGTGWRQLPAVRGDSGTEQRPAGEFGVENAVLWGGNLSMLSALLGTPYFPDIRRGILFLEDTGEHPYRVERMLTHLLHAGVLDRQRAIILGQFTDYTLVPHDRGFRLQTVVQWLRTQTKTRILTNLPYGHLPTKVLLPVGARVDLAVQDREVLLVWGHV